MQKKQKKKHIMVLVKNGNKNCKVLFFKERDEAKSYIVDTYRNEIKKAPFYDYNNSYISKDHTYAQISAGVYSVKIMLCKNQKRYRR